MKIQEIIEISHLDNVHFEVVEDNETKEDSRFTDVKIWIAHTGKNLNKSNFSKDMLTSMIPSLTGIPIVGYIEVNDNNREDFKGHEERYIVTMDGVQTEYIGRAYGVVLEDNNAKFEMKTINGVEREYLTCDGKIWNKFSHAKDIIDRDGEKGQSMELVRESLDGYYVQETDEYIVTSAQFEALCILGDSKIPAMVGGTIEKTQFTTYMKNETQAMLEELKLEYAEKFTAKTDENEKGGNVDLIKVLEELLPNYEYVSAEFTEDLKGKLDTFETEEALKEVLETENQSQYALTINAQMNLLRNSVLGLEELNDWYHESRYWAKDADFEKGEVYVIDYKDWMDYGFTFTKEGEEFVIDSASKFKVAWQPMKLSEGQSANFTISEEVKQAYDFGVSKIESAKEEVKADYEKQITELKTEYDAQIESKDSELEQLRNYRAEIEKNQRIAHVNSVENLDDGEKQILLDNIENYTMETLEEEVIKMIGKKNIKFSANFEKPIKDDFIDRTPSEGETKSFDHLFTAK